MAWAAEYTSAEEMMAAYSARRQRLSHPPLAVIDDGIDLKRMPKGFRPAERKVLIEPVNAPAVVVPIRAKRPWFAPTFEEMETCPTPTADVWRRYVNGFCLVLEKDRERYCPQLNQPDFWANRDDDLFARVPRLKGGAVPKTAPEIVAAVALKHELSKTVLLSDRRRRREVWARHELYWWLRMLTPWSMPRIGRFLCDRDHTTILHGVRRHQARLDAGEA